MVNTPLRNTTTSVSLILYPVVTMYSSKSSLKLVQRLSILTIFGTVHQVRIIGTKDKVVCYEIDARTGIVMMRYGYCPTGNSSGRAMWGPNSRDPTSGLGPSSGPTRPGLQVLYRLVCMSVVRKLPDALVTHGRDPMFETVEPAKRRGCLGRRCRYPVPGCRV